MKAHQLAAALIASAAVSTAATAEPVGFEKGIDYSCAVGEALELWESTVNNWDPAPITIWIRKPANACIEGRSKHCAELPAKLIMKFRFADGSEEAATFSSYGLMGLPYVDYHYGRIWLDEETLSLSWTRPYSPKFTFTVKAACTAEQ